MRRVPHSCGLIAWVGIREANRFRPNTPSSHSIDPTTTPEGHAFTRAKNQPPRQRLQRFLRSVANQSEYYNLLYSIQIGRSHMGNEQPTIQEWMIDPVLYHYTTLDALLSIVQHSALWATHIRYMNDTSEQNVLWDRLRKTAGSRLEKEHCPNSEWLTEVMQATEDRMQTDVFAVCFSKDGGNRLSQWRGYSQGSGVSIGFNIFDLQRYCGAFCARWRASAPEGSHGGALLLPAIYVMAT